MNATQIDFLSRRGGRSQCDKILAVLQDNAGQWVPIPVLHQASGSYVIHSRIADLRKRGHSIDQRSEHHDGQNHSFYRLNLGANEAAA